MPGKKRIHIRQVSDKCPCGRGQQAYSAGEYVNGKWHNATAHFCANCVKYVLLDVVAEYRERERREVELVGYQGMKLPLFLG